jgi:hypothetical protein
MRTEVCNVAMDLHDGRQTDDDLRIFCLVAENLIKVRYKSAITSIQERLKIYTGCKDIQGPLSDIMPTKHDFDALFEVHRPNLDE